MKYRVLEVTLSPLDHGGIQVFWFNTLPRLSDFQITAMFMGGCIESGLKPLLTDGGVKVICANIASDRSDYLEAVCDSLRRELSTDVYSIVHIHTGWARAISELAKTAKRAGVRFVIAHTHNIIPVRPKIKRVFYPSLYASISGHSDALLACSDEAGCATFGKREWRKRGEYVPNGIDLARFSGNLRRRGSIRGDDRDSFIVGQVGRLVEQKNYPFTFRVFAALQRIVPEAKLWILGDGELRSDLEQLASKLCLDESVVFFGGVDDPAPYYQDMDAFIMPSIYEGLGIALVEAQASGLPCLVSDRIPIEASVDGCCVERMSLSAEPSLWAQKLASFRNCGRLSSQSESAFSRFSVGVTVDQLRELYMRLLADRS